MGLDNGLQRPRLFRTLRRLGLHQGLRLGSGGLQQSYVASTTAVAPLDVVKAGTQQANFDKRVSGVTVVGGLVRVWVRLRVIWILLFRS